MTADTAVAIRERARARWGKKPPPEIVEPLSMLSALAQQVKPTSVLGPTLNEAALAVSRRLREEK